MRRHGQAPVRPVFLDRSGRRRRVVLFAGSGIALVLLTSLALLVAGLFGAAPAHIPGFPDPGSDRAGNDRPVVTPVPTPAPTSPVPAASTGPGTVTLTAPTPSNTRRHVPTQTPTHPNPTKKN
jgi:hypothetical protein